MRQPNDLTFAAEAVGVDLILGGHDHFYSLNTVNGINVLKSGTDFRDFSVVTVSWPKELKPKPKFEFQRISVTSDYIEDEELKAEIDKYSRWLIMLRMFGKFVLISTFGKFRTYGYENG